jgi:hypothetical protein
MTTFSSPDVLRFLRPEGNPDSQPAWLQVRTRTADFERRAEVPEDANQRYPDAWNGQRMPAHHLIRKAPGSHRCDRSLRRHRGTTNRTIVQMNADRNH